MPASGPAYRRCEDCGAALFPARHQCASCGSRRLSDETSSGRGVVYSTTLVQRRDGAWWVALVDLEEGFRMMGTIVGMEPVDVRIGLAVQARHDGERFVFDAV
jgi:uncharacterized OB-fold protein